MLRNALSTVIALAVLLFAITVAPGAAFADDEPSPAPLVVAGGGGVLVLVGVVLGLLSAGEYDAARDATSFSEGEAALASGDSLATMANWMFVLGASAIAIGGAWASVEFTRETRMSLSLNRVELSHSF